VNAESIRKLFEQVRRGKLAPDAAVDRLRHLPFEDLGFAKVDHHRSLRAGMPEVIFGERKTPLQVAEIFARLAKHGGNVLATHADKKQFAAVKKKIRAAEYRELARAIVLQRDPHTYGKGMIAVVSAGTSDIPSAGESRSTDQSPRPDCLRRNGRRAAQRGRWTRRRSGDRRPHKRRLRCVVQRPDGSARNVEFLRVERQRGEH
jgi:hypothetical protein